MKTTNAISIPAKAPAPPLLQIKRAAADKTRHIPPTFSSAWVSLYIQLRNMWASNN